MTEELTKEEKKLVRKEKIKFKGIVAKEVEKWEEIHGKDFMYEIDGKKYYKSEQKTADFIKFEKKN